MLPMIASNASAAFPRSLLRVSASLSSNFFRVPKDYCCNDHREGSRESILRQCLSLVPQTGYEFSPPRMHLYQERSQAFALSLPLVFEDLFDSVIVSPALPVSRCSDRLTCLYTTVSVHWSNLNHFVLLVTFWYPFQYVYQFPSVLKYYLLAHPVCLVRPCQFLKTLAYLGRYFVMLLVFQREFLQPRMKALQKAYFPSLSQWVAHF